MLLTPQNEMKNTTEASAFAPQAGHGRKLHAVAAGILLILLSAGCFYFFPYERLTAPAVVSSQDELASHNGSIVTITPEILYDTGCSGENGRYYYALANGQCCYYLLTGDKSAGFPEQIQDYTVTGLVSQDSPSVSTLDQEMTASLNWSSSGMASVSAGIIVSEQHILSVPLYRLLLCIAAFSGIFGVFCLFSRRL